MSKFQSVVEEIRVLGHELTEKVKELIHEGNVRRIIIKNEHGHIFMEIPVTVAAIATILAPVLAAVGAIAALAGKFTVVVEKEAPTEEKAAEAAAFSSQTEPTP